MMTQPTLINCSHRPDGWCLSCVAVLAAENERMKQSMYQCELLRVMKDNEKLQSEAKAFRDALDVQLKLGKELIVERDALQKSNEELNEAWMACGASHAILCCAIKRALGIKYWPIFEGGIGENAAKMLDAHMEKLNADLKLWKPMTNEEAERAIDEAECVPISEERIRSIIDQITDPTYRPSEPEYVLLAARVKQLDAVVAKATNLVECWRATANIMPDSCYDELLSNSLRLCAQQLHEATKLPENPNGDTPLSH